MVHATGGIASTHGCGRTVRGKEGSTLFDPFHPERFQGSLGRPGLFEGWYFRLADRGGQGQWAVIVGVATGAGAKGTHGVARADGVEDPPYCWMPPSPESAHCFVQVLPGDGSPVLQARYPLGWFGWGCGAFAVYIGNPDGGEPVFFGSRQRLWLRVAQGGRSFQADVRFVDAVPFPGTPHWPGIMGPFGFLPGMECYHAIVSIRHGLVGTLCAADGAGGTVTHDLTGGLGYTEKDWGRSFPRAWVWLHANRFGDGATFFLSAADIPWHGRTFPGFFAFLHRPGQRLTLFATYARGRLGELTVQGHNLQGSASGPAGTLSFQAAAGRVGTLAAPLLGRMERTVEESPDARVWVRLTAPSGTVMYEGESDGGGMEVSGELALR